MGNEFSIDSIPKYVEENFDLVDPIELISEKSKNTEYVIINETHHSPHHRVFAKSLLKELYNQGYRNLAIETLSINDEYEDKLLNVRKYPLVNSGTYSREPQFGNFIREALKFGYNVFPYDIAYAKGMSMSSKEREIGAAKTIISNKGKGKTLIFCGFDHVLEGHIGGAFEYALAERIKQFSGIDPLTINQTQFDQKSNPSFEHPWFSKWNITDPKVLMHNEKPFKIKNYSTGYCDIAIIHPRTTYIKNRPSFAFSDKTKIFSLNVDTIKVAKPYLILAFKSEENYTSSVPVDIIEVNDNIDTEMNFILEKGVYNFIIPTTPEKAYLISKEVK